MKFVASNMGSLAGENVLEIGDLPVGPFSLLRSAEEYTAALHLPVIAQSDFYYGGGRSDLLLSVNNYNSDLAGCI